VGKIRDELSLMMEPPSYIGEVVKVMGKKKVLVKVWSFELLTLLTTFVFHGLNSTDAIPRQMCCENW